MKPYVRLLIYSLISIGIGILVGAIDALFGRVLLAITDFRSAHAAYLLPFLALAGLLILFFYQKISPKASKGMALIYETAFGENEDIPKALIPLIMVCTWLTHLFGGSAGREGVAVQIGAALSHTIGRNIGKKFPVDSRLFLVVGMAAGFGGLFQTPLAATFFALEVLVSGTLIYEALLPALAAAGTASVTSHLLGLEKFSVSFSDQIALTPETLIKLVIIGILFGVTGGLFAKLLALTKQKLGTWIKNPYIRIFVTGICLSVLLLLLWKGRYSGLGTNLISLSFSGTALGEQVFACDFILKFALTVLTLAAGYQGGEVTPLFSIGATLGVLLASLFGLPVLLVAALGYAAVFGAATNTLLAPILIGVEVFGADHAVPFVIICSIAFACNGNQSIYGKQRIYKPLKSIL